MRGAIAGSITCRADSMTFGRLPHRHRAKLFRGIVPATEVKGSSRQPWPRLPTSLACWMSGVAAIVAPSIGCCRSCMRSCAGSLRARCVASEPGTACSRRRSSMRRTCDSWISGRSIGATAHISLLLPPRSCVGFSSTTLVVIRRASAATVSGPSRSIRRWRRRDPGLAQIVELRAFGGLTVEEAAHVLNVSTSTAKREWRTAKAWLTRELGAGGRA
jgi:ECF sigma factor